jgi:hypothetical protein
MIRRLKGLLAIAVFFAPGVGLAVTDADFEANTTRKLLNLCTVSREDPRHEEAIHFCHGYLVGAFDYHEADRGPEHEALVCFPEPPPERNDVVAQFVAWALAHPKYMDEVPVETEFRFLIETWPCKG